MRWLSIAARCRPCSRPQGCLLCAEPCHPSVSVCRGQRGGGSSLGAAGDTRASEPVPHTSPQPLPCVLGALRGLQTSLLSRWVLGGSLLEGLSCASFLSLAPKAPFFFFFFSSQEDEKN